MLQALLLTTCFVVGALLQVRHPRAPLVRTRTWSANMAIVIPIAIVYAVLTIRVDAQLAAAFACGVVAWWLTVAVSLGYGRIASPSDVRVRGALAMSAAFPNTAFLGFPLAQLAFGVEGLRITVVYDAIGPIIPAVVLSTVIAQAHAGDGAQHGAATRMMVRALMSPPTVAIIVGACIRIVLLDAPLDLHVIGSAIGPVVGSIGFFVAGLSIPLVSIVHDLCEVMQVAGSLMIRILVAPLLLLGTGNLVGISIPSALLLACAMPTAVHVLVIAREHDLATHVVRLAILVSTAIALIVVPLAVALAS